MRRYILDLDDTLARTTEDLGGDPLRGIEGDPARIPYLTLVPGAVEFLETHKKSCILLTAGKKEDQDRKIEVLGIREYFKEIHIVPRPLDKLKKLEEIVGKLKRWRSTFNIIIIGDRLDVELSKGVQLGCITARIRIPGGRHSHEISIGSPITETPWMEAKDFNELMKKFPGLMC